MFRCPFVPAKLGEDKFRNTDNARSALQADHAVIEDTLARALRMSIAVKAP